MRYIKASGSFEQIGLQVGETCRPDIPEVYELGMEYLLKHTPIGRGERIEKRRDIIHGRAQFYLYKGEELWKPSGEYLRAQARGAGVSDKVIAVTSFTEEVSSETGILPPEKCSTLVVRQPDSSWMLVHSEDYEKHYLGKMVILKVTFDGFPQLVCCTYPGMLPGLAGSFNASGIGILNTALYPLAQPGWPKQVPHCRASLALTLEEAEYWLTMQPVSVTTHYVVVHGPSRQVISLIVSNLQTAQVEVDRKIITEESFCHTNHLLPGRLLLHLPDPAIEVAPNSFVRYEKLNSLAPHQLPRNPKEAFELFSQPPIFRDEGPSGSLIRSVICFGDKDNTKVGEVWIEDVDPTAGIKIWYFIVK